MTEDLDQLRDYVYDMVKNFNNNFMFFRQRIESLSEDMKELRDKISAIPADVKPAAGTSEDVKVLAAPLHNNMNIMSQILDNLRNEFDHLNKRLYYLERDVENLKRGKDFDE